MTAITREKNMHTKKMIAAMAALVAGQAAFAADGKMIDRAYIEIGNAPKLNMVRLGATQDFPSSWQWFNSNGNAVSGYWDASIGAWQGREHAGIPGERQHIVDVGLTPVFRWQANSKKGWFAEGGIGVHLLSKTYNNRHDQLSTAFQFGDHLGLGYVFDNRWEMTAKFQHFSNGGIKEPNSGVNLLMVRAAYRY
jgi:lipid A 3-O-deacylase